MRIEKEQLEPAGPNDPFAYNFGVRIFMRSGEILCLAKYLAADDAHFLAVRLNDAIEQLRIGDSVQVQWSANRRKAYID